MRGGGPRQITDFARLGTAPQARRAFVLVETEELKDIDGLFREYHVNATHTETDAFPRGIRRHRLHVVATRTGSSTVTTRRSAPANRHPLMIMEREEAAARAAADPREAGASSSPPCSTSRGRRPVPER